MSTLKIGDPVPSEYTSTFVCEIDVMFGDCDDEKIIRLVVTPDQVDELNALLADLKINDETAYHLTTNFRKFFVDRYFKSEGNPNAVEWPFENDFDVYYAYECHRYFWYDQDGRKFKTEVIES